VFFCVRVQVEALRRADHPSKESYRMSLIKKLRKLSPMLQAGASSHVWEQRGRKQNLIIHYYHFDARLLGCGAKEIMKN
jgi:hypothetical protein